MAAAPIIDFHVYVFPEPELPSRWPQWPLLRKTARAWLRPITGSLHEAQPMIRHLPEALRHGLDELGGIAPIPSLLFESTTEDLLETMEQNEIDQALVVAHPPYVTNDFVLETCSENPASDGSPRLLPVVYIPKETAKPGAALKKLAARGARALKIHPAADGDAVDSARYKALLKAADELGLPVILHTGQLHTSLLFKNPELGRADLFAPWFNAFPKTQFVLAHMNWHEPQIALDLALEHPNIWVGTSWQPAEVIGEAVRRIGSERILFSSDWPLVGNNISVSLRRVRDAVDNGWIRDDDAQAILGGNAVRLLGIEAIADAS